MALSDPTTDPAFMAYQRALGVEESDARGAVAQRISALQRALNLRLAGYGPSEKQDTQKMDDNYEDRGLFRSGSRLSEDQNIANDYEGKRLGDVSDTYNQIAGAQMDLASQIAKMRRDAAEQGLTSATNMTLANGGLNG